MNLHNYKSNSNDNIITMDPYQSTQHAIADGNSSSDANKRRHNTLKERIKRSMNKAGGATVRRRSSLLAAASALASLAGGGGSKVTDTDTNTEMVDTPGQSTGKANNDLHEEAAHEERWRAATTAEEVPITFPQKLMSVLDNDELQDIITWLPHGRAFIILQKKKFASDVMPVYFKHSKFTSFTRKLNRWGFTRVPRGPETGSYYHKYFQRGNHHLCMQMHCQSKPNTSNSPRTSPPPPAVEPQKVAAKAKVPVSPGSKVAAAMSTLRMEASPLENRDQDGHRPQVDFKTTLSRQQELLRMDQDQEDQRRKKLREEQQQHDQKALAALYHSSRRTRDSPERKVKEQVELPSNLPAMPFLPSSGRRQNRSFLSSSLSSSTGQHQHQSLPSSFTASGTSPHASLLSNSWNTEPNTRTSMATSPRAERKRLHHLKDIDWSKISNYRMQEERRELPDQGMVEGRPYLPAPQETAMASRRQMMAPAPAYETMLNDYKRNNVALDTTSTAQHRHVIQSAMDALQASNDRGYLATLMQREREKAQGRVAPDEHVSQLGFQNDGHVHAAMQMRQLEGRYQQGSPALSEYLPLPTDLAQSPGRVEQLQQRMKLLSSASYIKANPQVHVAPPNPPPQSKYPFGGVRRASAA